MLIITRRAIIAVLHNRGYSRSRSPCIAIPSRSQSSLLQFLASNGGSWEGTAGKERRAAPTKFEVGGVRLDAAGSQRQDQQQASRCPHASAAVDLQDSRGRGQVAVQQRGRGSVEVVEFAAGHYPPAAQPVSIDVDVPGRLVTPTTDSRILSRPLKFLERLEKAARASPKSENRRGPLATAHVAKHHWTVLAQIHAPLNFLPPQVVKLNEILKGYLKLDRLLRSRDSETGECTKSEKRRSKSQFEDKGVGNQNEDEPRPRGSDRNAATSPRHYAGYVIIGSTERNGEERCGKSIGTGGCRKKRRVAALRGKKTQANEPQRGPRARAMVSRAWTRWCRLSVEADAVLVVWERANWLRGSDRQGGLQNQQAPTVASGRVANQPFADKSRAVSPILAGVSSTNRGPKLAPVKLPGKCDVSFGSASGSVPRAASCGNTPVGDIITGVADCRGRRSIGRRRDTRLPDWWIENPMIVRGSEWSEEICEPVLSTEVEGWHIKVDSLSSSTFRLSARKRGYRFFPKIERESDLEEYGRKETSLSLRDILPLNPKQYDKHRAPKFLGQPTIVYFHVTVLSLDSINEESMTYVADIFLAQSWRDSRLRLPENMSEEYRILDVDWLHNIWRPDCFFKNAKKVTFHEMSIPNHYLWLYHDKTLLYMSKLTLVLSCAMKFESYPHDTQICSMMIESLSHTTQDLVFIWNMTDPLVVNPEIELPQLDISNNYTTDCTIEYSTGNFTCIQIVFNLRRRLGYHLFHTYIPSALIVVMSWIAFWIKPEAIPARVTLGVTSLLTLGKVVAPATAFRKRIDRSHRHSPGHFPADRSIDSRIRYGDHLELVWLAAGGIERLRNALVACFAATQNTQSQQSLPPVSYVKAIDVWMSSCSVFVFLSLMEFAVVNNYMGPVATKAMKGYSDEDLREAIDEFKTPMRNESERSRSPVRPVTVQYDTCCQGRATAIYIDKVSRFFFPFSFLILNVVYWSTFL
ncbi:Glycine receptor subunit alpha-2 [Eufriesea mexicana]|uniref:Glycine receptor subunit alpha-2 n=1 Tax=Eufriesea mexicana TaxID=516756 RepID=A0A310SEG0_9HYME|nr:Glycine receptor subunit alpha-2 [Eufriesea mexicana]